MKIGVIGLGKMGSRIARKLIEDGHEVFVWNRSPEGISNFKYQISNIKSRSNVRFAESIEGLVRSLDRPRIVWIMVNAGEATQEVLDELNKFVETEDIVVDGGNSFYKDTQRGGLVAAETGYPLMVGGDVSAYRYMTTIFDSLSKPTGGHAYFGEGGAGHFVKMVHNGMEYGYMQALGEGFGVLEKSSYNLNLLEVAKLYQKGTLLSGFMMDRTVEVLEKDPGLKNIVGLIGESGEAKWTVDTAKEEGVLIENIEQALEFRLRSQKEETIQKSFAARLAIDKK
ncbi:MAG: NAD(P)-binding domain-containing protein [Candidatus Levybacteria bacterium]|nr:NAD(P)-binding domain-containing protein [Candidatus Levybacteria bacterium]